MATLISAQNIAKTFGAVNLFEGVSLQLSDGARLGLIGPNGAGKSTLLKILAGLETTDAGEVKTRGVKTSRGKTGGGKTVKTGGAGSGGRMVYVAQDDQFGEDATVLSAVVDALKIAENRGHRDEHDHYHHELDAETQAAITLSKLGFEDFDQLVRTLSGGWRKRLSIACALAQEPEVLMLDEPTNHLDMEGILWLERFVQSARLAVVFVTHDRQFLENAAARIIELSAAYPGGTFEVMGNYSEFVRRKADFLSAQAQAQTALANRVRQDTAWLKQGIQGRQTRNKTQVADAATRRAELKAVKGRNEAPTRTTSIEFQATQRKSKKLLLVQGLAKSMGDRLLFTGLDLSLSPGVRLGLLGPNGSGKTTLLRILNDQLAHDEGTIERAENLRIVVFSQHRDDLDHSLTLQEALCNVGDRVEYRGQSVHVNSWAKRFLFEPSQLHVKVRSLSGGEKARVLVAQLMLKPADVLLLDEPTNDLDISSLEVLENALLEFPGAIVLVTHDRFMLERISTEFLVLDGEGGARGHAGFAQCQDAVAAQIKAANKRKKDENKRKKAEAKERRNGSKPSKTTAAPPKKVKKLSFKLKKELDEMEAVILAAEEEVMRLEAQVADPVVMADHARVGEIYGLLGKAAERVRVLYERWAELEAL